jgi:hypothetical protein
MNVFSMNFASRCVDHGYLQLFIVAQAFVAKMLCKLFAMFDRFGIRLEFDADTIPHRDAVFHIKEECLHGR